VFDGVLSKLAKSRRVTRINLPGFGRSTPVQLDSVGAHADHVARVMGALELPRDTDVFGNGFGAFVALELAKMIVRDGEGVTRFITLHIHGGRTAGDAEAVARSVGNSTLVKTSWFGGDPNWGRILCAIGYSQAKVDESKVDVGYSQPKSTKIAFAVRRGQPTRVGLQTLGAIVAKPEFDLHIFLNAGRHDCVLYTSDLTEEYVEFNKGDLSDPTSLGG